MLAPLSWIKDYVDIDVTPKELEEKMFSCCFEVEELIEVGKDISNVVVGLVESCEPIPDTHLSLCQVNAGEHGTFQICCGAANVRAGGKYPLALVGATVYATAKDHVTIEGVMTIKNVKLRGYESYGMLCSGTELGLNVDLNPGAGYNGLLVLPEDAKAGADVKPILGMDDWIFDIAITANRPDCQSIYGIAREVAAVLGKECREPALDYTEPAVKKDNKLEQQIEDLTDRLKRNMAEFDNFRTRTEKEKSSMYVIGAKDIFEKILPVVDNFERGLAQAPEDDPFAEGMQKIYKQFTTTMEGMGVEPIEAVGKEFNPDFHNAVMHEEDESSPPHHGYSF